MCTLPTQVQRFCGCSMSGAVAGRWSVGGTAGGCFCSFSAPALSSCHKQAVLRGQWAPGWPPALVPEGARTFSTACERLRAVCWLCQLGCSGQSPGRKCYRHASHPYTCFWVQHSAHLGLRGQRGVCISVAPGGWWPASTCVCPISGGPELVWVGCGICVCVGPEATE